MAQPAVNRLPRAVAAAPGKPVRPEAVDEQTRTRRLVEDANVWTSEAAEQTVDRYRTLAPQWDADRGAYRPAPLRDALARGGPMPDGLCLEIGSGTGLLTPLVRDVWPRTISLDVSPDMLTQSMAPWRVRADAVRLPVGDGTTSVIVLADAPLFAAEAVRVLTADGVVVWSNALGRDAPHHVPLDALLAALDAATPGRPWTAVTSDAGWGLWAVLRRVD